MQLPATLAIEFERRHEDVFEHLVRFAVPGNRASAVEAVVQSDFYDFPRPLLICSNGLGLPDLIAKRLLVAVFERMKFDLTAVDGPTTGSVLTVPDITDWLRAKMTPSEQTMIVGRLQQFECPNPPREPVRIWTYD
jgi:hypothetical protein